jgi:hypothetical protein
MNAEDGHGETSSERRDEESERRERSVAPPIEREHETQAGIFEEDERRERERR